MKEIWIVCRTVDTSETFDYWHESKGYTNKEELEEYNIFYNKDTDKGYVIADFGTIRVYKDATALVSDT